MTIILIGKARMLLTDEAFDVVDAEILEKHLPVIQELEIPLIIPHGSSKEYAIDPEFSVQEASLEEIQSHMFDAHRVMVLG